MEVKLRNVQQRGNALYFRMSIPEDLRWHYEGKREISRALKAHDELEAKSWARILAVVYKKQFSDLRAGRNVDGVREGDTILESLQLGNSPRIIGMAPDAQVYANSKTHSLSMVYAEVCSLGKQSERSELERGNTVKLLLEWFGDIAIEKFTRPMLLEFRDQALCCLRRKSFRSRSGKRHMLIDLTGPRGKSGISMILGSFVTVFQGV